MIALGDQMAVAVEHAQVHVGQAALLGPVQNRGHLRRIRRPRHDRPPPPAPSRSTSSYSGDDAFMNRSIMR